MDNEKMSNVAERVSDATTTLEEITRIPEKGIPKEMLENAAAIVVIPNLVKAAFVVGGEHGKGVMSVRGKDGWSLPTFVQMTGGSVGWQAGVQATDLVLVFMSERNVKALMNGEFTLGADASVAAGPVGRNASAGTNPKITAEIYSYSRSRGAFAGISLDGSKLSIDNDANAQYYGKGATAESILWGTDTVPPKSAKGFQVALADLAKSK
ncbi:MAG: lipid-binding SYLF domain-containing protein [bacterium]